VFFHLTYQSEAASIITILYKSFCNRTNQMQNKAHQTIANMLQMYPFHKNWRQKLESCAMILGVPDRFL
jgi:hypothetical protein